MTDLSKYREELAEALKGRMDVGTSGRWIAEYGETPSTLADALLPVVERIVAEAQAEASDAPEPGGRPDWVRSVTEKADPRGRSGVVECPAGDTLTARLAIALHDAECPDDRCDPMVMGKFFRQAGACLEPVLARMKREWQEEAWDEGHNHPSQTYAHEDNPYRAEASGGATGDPREAALRRSKEKP